jgi:hypothetical protein
MDCAQSWLQYLYITNTVIPNDWMAENTKLETEKKEAVVAHLTAL